MRKIILACVVLFSFFTNKIWGQPYTFSSKFPVNTEVADHRTFFHYAFDRSYMVITNEYALEPSIKKADLFIHYPYTTRKIQVYGPTLGFTITANGNPSDFINPAKVTSAGTLVWDTIFKNIIEAREKKQQMFFQKPSKAEMDSIVKNEKKFDLAALQVRIIKNHKLLQDWKNVSRLKTITLATDVAKGNFVVYNDSLEVNDKVVITFRNKKDSSLIQFEFERIDSPLFPFLAAFQRDTTSISYTDFVRKFLEKKLAAKYNTDKFYRYWPARRDAALKNERIFTGTKLAFIFRKPEPGYVDTTMEYLLSTGSIQDSLWQTTGHLLFLSDFKPGSDYTLLIRYKSTPGNIMAYRFHTLPQWYQTGKYRFIIAGVIILLLFALLFLLSRIRLQKEKKKIAYLQFGLRSIRSQLNPHFIFNALSSIQGLINKNDMTGANHYLTEFSSLLRESLKNNDRELVPLDSELRILETYLKLEQLRFHFQYEIIVDETIDKNALEIPALLLQPLIENAIKHGVAGLHETGRVIITFNATHKNVEVSIADNGTGFIQNTAKQGLGLKLTKDRIRLLNQSFKKQPIQLSIESAPNNGTTVHLGFENWL
jgi:two-component system LytT family sensor kinase